MPEAVRVGCADGDPVAVGGGDGPAGAAAAELERGGDVGSLRPGLLAEMDDSALAGVLERLAFSARIGGRADAEPGDGR